MNLFGDKRRRTFAQEALPHQESLYRMAVSLTRDRAVAQDIVQDTYREAWRGFDRYQPGSNCKAWLFTILFRVNKRHSRRGLAHLTVSLDEVPERQLSSQPDFEDRLNNEVVIRLLDSLPEHYRLVLILADVESLSYREISATAGIPIGTVMSRLNRARSLLREKLAGNRNTARSA